MQMWKTWKKEMFSTVLISIGFCQKTSAVQICIHVPSAHLIQHPSSVRNFEVEWAKVPEETILKL